MLRTWLVGGSLGLAACGGVAAPSTQPTTPGAPVHAAPARPNHADDHADDHAPIDPIAALTPSEDADVSWLAPGQAQLELGAAQLENPGATAPLEVTILESHGNKLRVAVRLPHARFSLWTDHDRLFAVVRTTQQLGGYQAQGDVHVTLRPGARVKRLAHRKESTQVRYSGALELEGWVPDSALADAGPPHENRGRFPTGRKTEMVMPGAIIRREAKWAADELAVIATGYFLDSYGDLADGWIDVGYDDGDLSVRGFLSRQLPPGRVHHHKPDPEAAPVPITPNGKVPSGTCLYARQGGEAIGYIVGDRDVDLVDAGGGWWTLTLDSPWGPIAFAAHGPTRVDLVACAPVGTVPAPAGVVAPVPAPTVP